MRPGLRTNYFYYRRYLDERLWCGLELYTYLMAERFSARVMLTLTGIYFDRPIDGTKSNEVVLAFNSMGLWDRLKTRLISKLKYPKEL